MKREEAMQILQLYKDELEQRIDEADAPDVKDVYRWQMDGFDMAIEALSAEAVQGEWIFRTDIPIGGGRESAGYVCSNCRKDYFRVDGMNFCPNCGADMRKEKE